MTLNRASPWTPQNDAEASVCVGNKELDGTLAAPQDPRVPQLPQDGLGSLKTATQHGDPAGEGGLGRQVSCSGDVMGWDQWGGGGVWMEVGWDLWGGMSGWDVISGMGWAEICWIRWDGWDRINGSNGVKSTGWDGMW